VLEVETNADCCEIVEVLAMSRKRLHRRRLLGFSAIIASAVIFPQAVNAQEAPVGNIRSAALEVVETQVRKAFVDVTHLTPEVLARMLDEKSDRIVLLDVRTADEYAVSHLRGAIHVPPDSRSAAEIAVRAGGLDGKIVVAYCSIGLRSARLLVRIGQGLKERGATELHNLQGGAFRWRNERRDLVKGNAPTRDIHQYNVLWRQFLVEPPEAPKEPAG
jgi:rhodanese-related sulfurtransferase